MSVLNLLPGSQTKEVGRSELITCLDKVRLRLFMSMQARFYSTGDGQIWLISGLRLQKDCVCRFHAVSTLILI